MYQNQFLFIVAGVECFVRVRRTLKLGGVCLGRLSVA